TECQQRGFRAIGGIVGGTETLESGAKIENGFAFGQLRGTNATRSNVGTIVGRGQVDITNAAGLTEIVAGGVKGTPFGASFGSFTITNVHHSATGVSVTDQNDQSVTLSATQQQSWWQNVLTFNFTNVWKWNASENRPELAWE
ncbi:MAG: hypothetical protein LBG61_07415, partial [Burkholderiales bacterium]|nr:hypothetical protein [Burkholderiales bacterium]